MSKDDIIAEVYYDERHGFGSIQHTLKRAREKDSKITLDDVKEFLEKQEVKQQRKPLKVNSFVADLPRQEFQVDLADFGVHAKPRYCFVAIDIFSKKIFAMPLKAKGDAFHAVAPMFRALGYPISIMSDEGGEFKGEFSEELHADLVEPILSRTGGRFVERAIRTLKMALHLRTHSLEGSWDKYLQPVVEQYNERVHTTTGARPNNVARKEYDMNYIKNVHAQIQNHAKFPLKHPPLNIGDYVKIRIKPSGYGEYKETFNSWSVKAYKVLGKDANLDGGTKYRLEGYHRSLLRYELKKVKDVQKPNVVGGKLARGRSATYSLLFPREGEENHEDGGRASYGGSSGSGIAREREANRVEEPSRRPRRQAFVQAREFIHENADQPGFM